jgi:phage shock protein A
MDNKTDPKLLERITNLEKVVSQLTAHIQRVEAENKRLKSRLIRIDGNVSQIQQKIQKG